MIFIENLLNLMNQRGITAYQLEKEIGIKQSTFGKWKKGSQPTLDNIIKILNYFQVSPDILIKTKISIMSDNDKELLELFHQLPEREQIKLIGRVEDLVNKYKE